MEIDDHIFLFGCKWRSSVHISSMKYFHSLPILKKYLKDTNQNVPNPTVFVWRVYSDDREAKLLSLKELQELGVRG